MKKYFLYASIASLALSLGACSDQLDNPVVGGNDGTVIFTAQLPEGLASRAESFNQGEKATNLSYAVYKNGTETPEIIFASGDGAAPEASYDADTKSFTLSLNLVKGQTYDFVFWADADNSPYTFKAADQSVTIDYTNVAGNDDARDAFFTSITGLTVSGAMQKNVELRRPFAQLNIGTDDIEAAKAAKVEHATTTVTVNDVYSTLNLLNGLAKDPVEVVFPAHAASELTFPVTAEDKDYTYLSMNYILTGSVILDGDVNMAQKETKDLTIAFADVNGNQINEFNLSAVPFQRNYRTNVYGSLLTSQVDFVIDIVPGFWEEPGHNYEVVDVWDGETVTRPEKNEAGVYEINSAAELVGMMELVVERNDVNAKIELNTSVDFDGQVFRGINPRQSNATYANHFNGVFDGQGNTIRNFRTRDNEYQYAYGEGFVGSNTGTIKNLVIENVEVGSFMYDNAYGNVVGIVAGYNYGTIENVTVRNCTVYGYGKVGGLVGMDEDHGTYRNCTVENTTVYATYNGAQLIGNVQGNPTIENCTLTGNKVKLLPYGSSTEIEIEPSLAFDTKNGTRTPMMIGGTFTDMGGITRYSTGAVYYNRYDVLNREGYHLWYNGNEVEVDGYPVNSLPEEKVYVDALPADIQPITESGNKLEGFWGSATTNEYYITSAAGLSSWNNWWLKRPDTNSTIYGRTFNLMADIDATGTEWTSVWTVPGSNANNGFVINGNNHTIKGLTLLPCQDSANKGCSMFGGNFAGGNEGTTPGVIKNITFEDVTANGFFHVGVVAGQVYGKLNIENVHVVNSHIEGTCNVGGIVGSTTVETGNVELTMTNCSVTGSTITSRGGAGMDPTGASIFIGRALSTAKWNSTISLVGCSESNNTVTNPEDQVGGLWWGSVTYAGGWQNPTAHGAE